MEVLTDQKISFKARVVYSFLAGCAFDGPDVTVGQRLIGESLGTSRASVTRALKELAGAGHVEAVPGPMGMRARYRLKSPVFSLKRSKAFASGLSTTVRAARAWAENAPKVN